MKVKNEEISKEEFIKFIEEINIHIPEIGRRIKDTFHPSFTEIIATSILAEYKVVKNES